MVTELKGVPVPKSLTDVAICLAPPGKTRSSPGLGAVPPTQLAPALQLALPPRAAPVQTRVAGARRSSRTKSVPGRNVGRRGARALRRGRSPRNHLRHAAGGDSDIASVLSADERREREVSEISR